MTSEPAYASAEGNIKEDYMKFLSAFPLYQYKFPETGFSRMVILFKKKVNQVQNKA